MFVSRKVLIAVLALGVVAIEATAAPASAATETTTMSIGLTIVAPGSIAGHHDTAKAKATSKANDATNRASIHHLLSEQAAAALGATSKIAKNAGLAPEVTTHAITNARLDTVVTTLSY